MKTKKIQGKLVLKKVTIANLDGNEMRGIYGGAPKETRKCVETDVCETNACETNACETNDCTMAPEFCPPPSSVVTSCFITCNNC